MKKRLLKAAAAFIILAVFLWSPFSNYPVSLAVMKIYSGIHEHDSIMAEKGIELRIPGGGVTWEKDWYPFVMTFNDDAGFRRFTGEADVKLTILYNFPAFDLLKGCSRLYDPASPYYNGFYGAYLVCYEDDDEEEDNAAGADGTDAAEHTDAAVDEGGTNGAEHTGGKGRAGESGAAYGFLPDGSLDLMTVAQVPQFDFQKLVLQDFGIGRDQMVFDWEVSKSRQNVSYLGIDGWTRVDAELSVNGTWHEADQFRRSYLQYGLPRYDLLEYSLPGEAFAPVEMTGRVYGRYFEEWDTSIFFYVLASDPAVLEDCDREILSQSSLGSSERP